MSVLAEFSDHSAGAADHLAGLTLLVDLAQTAPLAKLLARGDHKEVHVVFLAKGLNELGVRRLVAVSSKATKASLLAVKSLHRIDNSARKIQRS